MWKYIPPELLHNTRLMVDFIFVQDHVLLPLLMEEEEEKKGDPLLVVHPNYVVET